MAPVDFSGTWKEYKKENFDEFSAAVGMPWIVRKMAGKAYPTIEVVQTDDHFKITTTMVMMNEVVEFSIGEEFVFEPPRSGIKIMQVAHWEEEKLVIVGKPDKPENTNVVEQTTIRELIGDETVVSMHMKCKDRDNIVVMKRFFSRVK